MSNKKTNFLKRKSITASFAIIAIITGFTFLNFGLVGFTGNIILENKYQFDLLSLIGLLLIACSAILAIYSVKKR